MSCLRLGAVKMEAESGSPKKALDMRARTRPLAQPQSRRVRSHSKKLKSRFISVLASSRSRSNSSEMRLRRYWKVFLCSSSIAAAARLSSMFMRYS